MSKSKQDNINPNMGNETLERDQRVHSTVLEVFNIIANEKDIQFGSHNNEGEAHSQESLNAYYSDFVSRKILPVVFDEKKNLKVNDITYIFSIMLQVVSLTKDKVEQTMQYHYDNAIAYKFEKNSIDDITINDIDRIIKSMQLSQKVSEDVGDNSDDNNNKKG